MVKYTAMVTMEGE